MLDNIKYIYRLILEKLWFKPLIISLLSIAASLLAHFADNTFIVDIAPEIERSSVEDLLSTISSTMLVIAIFAVGAMLSAFSAASGTATPRSFKLVVADDVSQNALSVFIGSFIYSIVATIALQNGFYGKAGYFTLFTLTIAVFAIVIFTFLRWVERISKLGRLANTITKIEKATVKAIKERKDEPLLGGIPVSNNHTNKTPVFSAKIGYVQHINLNKLQNLAEELDVTFLLNCFPGTFTSPDKPLIFVCEGKAPEIKKYTEKINKAFIINDIRSFHEDPRFGLIALSEIASRALSTGINDPGTAIAIIESFVRVFTFWFTDEKNTKNKKIKYNRIEVPELSIEDMFYDAFRSISRDGAGYIEVMIRLQKAFKSITYIATPEANGLLLLHARQAYERAELAIKYPGDLETLKKVSVFENNTSK